MDRPLRRAQTLSAHVVSVVGQALATLATDPSLAPLIEAPSVRLNGKIQPGTRAAFTAAIADAAMVAALDARPLVRLHGDLFLENMLVRRASDPGGASLPRSSIRFRWPASPRARRSSTW